MITLSRLTDSAVEFLWVGGWEVGFKSHLPVQPNNCVEVVLRCVVGVGVLTIGSRGDV